MTNFDQLKYDEKFSVFVHEFYTFLIVLRASDPKDTSAEA